MRFPARVQKLLQQGVTNAIITLLRLSALFGDIGHCFLVGSLLRLLPKVPSSWAWIFILRFGIVLIVGFAFAD
jgi:hypothetical protein